MIRTSFKDQAKQKGGTRVPPFFFRGVVTLIELVMVIVIVSVLASVAFLTYRPTPIKARYQSERLRADLRHAQMLAVTQNAYLRFTVTAGTPGSYAVTTIGGIGTVACTTAPLTDPATGAAFSVIPDGSLTLGLGAVVPGPTSPTTIDFDPLGQPSSCAGVTCTCAVATTNTPAASYTVAGGGATYIVSVTAYTGFGTLTP